MPLGVMDGDFSQGEAVLSRGDKVVLFTDGVTEAQNVKGEEFGDNRLEELLTRERGLDAKALLLKIKNAVAEFARRAPQHDDITIIVMEAK